MFIAVPSVVPNKGWEVEQWAGPVHDETGVSAKINMTSSQTVLFRLVPINAEPLATVPHPQPYRRPPHRLTHPYHPRLCHRLPERPRIHRFHQQLLQYLRLPRRSLLRLLQCPQHQRRLRLHRDCFNAGPATATPMISSAVSTGRCGTVQPLPTEGCRSRRSKRLCRNLECL